MPENTFFIEMLPNVNHGEGKNIKSHFSLFQPKNKTGPNAKFIPGAGSGRLNTRLGEQNTEAELENLVSIFQSKF